MSPFFINKTEQWIYIMAVMDIKRKKSTLFLFFALTTAAQAAEEIPPGFESLVLGQVEQLDIRFAGRSLGLFSVNVKPETITLQSPDSVMKAAGLSVLPPDAQASVLSALSQPLSRNGHLACNGSSAPGCGYIAAKESVSAIMDESQGAVLLFLKPEWLGMLIQYDHWLRPTAQSHNAFIHSQSMNYIGDKYGDHLSLAGTGVLGLGENRHLASDWAATWDHQDAGQEQYRQWFNNVYARQDIGQQHYLQAGRMDQRNLSSSLGGNFGFTLLPLNRIDGLRAGSTAAYLDASAAPDATPLLVQITHNARVDIYRGKQLLGSQYLSPGVQRLNSNTFPSGSYPVALAVYENGVLQRTEQQIFSKSGRNNSSQLQWFVQGGRMTNDEDNALYSIGKRSSSASFDKKAGAAGFQSNIYRLLKLTSGFSIFNNKWYNETRLDRSFTFNFGVLDLAGSMLAGSDGSRGDTQQLTFTDGFSASLYRYRVRGAACTSISSALDIGCQETITASLSVPFAGWSMLLGYNQYKNDSRTYYRSNGNNDLTSSYYTWKAPVRSYRAWQLSASKAFRLLDTSLTTRLGLYQNQGNSNHDRGAFLSFTFSRASQSPTSTESGSFSSASVNWRSNKNDNQTNYSLNHTRMWQQGVFREMSVNATGYNDNSLAGSLGGRVNGRYGDLISTLSENRTRHGSNNMTLTSGYSSSFAVSREGFFWGVSGSSDPSAGTVIRVIGESDEKMDVADIQGGRNYYPLSLGFGQSVLLPLDGYRQSAVTVKDAVVGTTKVGMIGFTQGSGIAQYFLPPGRLVFREVSANITRSYLGRALGADGNPLSRARVLNQSLPALEEDGRFMLQTQEKLNTLWLIHDDRLLSCPLKVKSVRDVLQIVGDTRCDVSNADALPQSLKMSPRVRQLLTQAMHR